MSDGEKARVVAALTCASRPCRYTLFHQAAKFEGSFLTACLGAVGFDTSHAPNDIDRVRFVLDRVTTLLESAARSAPTLSGRGGYYFSNVYRIATDSQRLVQQPSREFGRGSTLARSLVDGLVYDPANRQLTLLPAESIPRIWSPDQLLWPLPAQHAVVHELLACAWTINDRATGVDDNSTTYQITVPSVEEAFRMVAEFEAETDQPMFAAWQNSQGEIVMAGEFQCITAQDGSMFPIRAVSVYWTPPDLTITESIVSELDFHVTVADLTPDIDTNARLFDLSAEHPSFFGKERGAWPERPILSNLAPAGDAIVGAVDQRPATRNGFFPGWVLLASGAAILCFTARFRRSRRVSAERE